MDGESVPDGAVSWHASGRTVTYTFADGESFEYEISEDAVVTERDGRTFVSFPDDMYIYEVSDFGLERVLPDDLPPPSDGPPPWLATLQQLERDASQPAN